MAGPMHDDLQPADLAPRDAGHRSLPSLHRRNVRILFGGVLPAGAATAASFSSAALLGKEITDSGLLGTLAAACVTVGGAAATVPIANHMARHGRRPGLRLGWLTAMSGATLALGSALLDFYPLLLVGAVAIGWGNSTNLAARYAASDLAPDNDRAKAIGLLVWAGSFGSVLGPTLGLGWAGSGAEWLGLPELAGPYIMAMALFAVAATWIDRRLRPDPLVVAGGITTRLDDKSRASLRSVVAAAGAPLRSIGANRSARLAAAAMLTGHAVMVGIMTATPLHMDDGDHELQIVGFVISLHIVGMYFFAPLVGWLVDRVGSEQLMIVGAGALVAGALLAANTPADDSTGVFVGLFLVGIGWSFGLIAGSSLLTASFPVEQRVPAQGAADLLMSASGAMAAVAGGVVYEVASYSDLGRYGALAATGLGTFALWEIFAGRRAQPRPANSATSNVPSGPNSSSASCDESPTG